MYVISLYLSIASFIASARTCEARGWTTEAFLFSVFGHRQLVKKKKAFAASGAARAVARSRRIELSSVSARDNNRAGARSVARRAACNPRGTRSGGGEIRKRWARGRARTDMPWARRPVTAEVRSAAGAATRELMRPARDLRAEGAEARRQTGATADMAAMAGACEDELRDECDVRDARTSGAARARVSNDASAMRIEPETGDAAR